MVTLQSEIPDAHAGEIEDSVREVFRDLPGAWTIRIRRAQPCTSWWGFVEIDGPKGFRRFFVVESMDEIAGRTRADLPLLRAVGRLVARAVPAATARRLPRVAPS